MDFISVIACVFSILGKISVNHKWRINFVFFISGYIAWVTWSLLTTPNIPMIIMYIIYTALSIDGWIKWRKEEVTKEYWIFTFGSDSNRAGEAVRVFAKSFSEAREKMVKVHGTKWAFQYSAEEWEAIVNDPQMFWYSEEVTEELL